MAEEESTLVVQDTVPVIEDVDGDKVPDKWIDLQFTWGGKPYSLSIAESDRVFDLKTSLRDLTTVPIDRQKILGLVKGKLPPDQARVADLKLVAGRKFSLIGTPEGDEIKDPSQLENLPDVVNDLDVDFTENMAASNRYQHDVRNIRKVKEMVAKLNLNIIHPLRPGKKLLVLDIDYTILDTKPLTSGSLPPDECARPYLHEFLEAVYPHYDICIWSQTSWIWLETKLVELGMVGANRNYHISFVLDKTSMFTVFTEREGKPWQHSVKALQIIWSYFPEFNASNTVHIDDLGRNFALNPKEGIKVTAFKGAHTPEARADTELVKLTQYLLHVANVPDFRTITHKDWRSVVKKLPRIEGP
ncbi:HAD-like domain-containing protein [Ephemerocybe angulata]|uniref:protein-serine/threonine phosphatase n=1 Tax=Ephemerocybe angulata TaxID=980116 RepID=A0A8H6IEF4_9AGAR|nr:HAD-like domain-containing protein [Tulosesus angulatus]